MSERKIHPIFSVVIFYVSNYFSHCVFRPQRHSTILSMISNKYIPPAESRSPRFFLHSRASSVLRFVSCVATTTRGSQTKRKFLTLISHLTRATCCFRFQMIKPQSERQCEENRVEEESSSAPGIEHHWSYGENFNWWLKTLTGFNWNLITVSVPFSEEHVLSGS